MKLSKEEKKEWKKIRIKVLEKQEYKCYLCGKEIKGKTANIHHIIDKRIRQFLLDENNLVGLCPRCHQLGPLAVHKTAIYFSEKLKEKDLDRFNYLIGELKNLDIK